MTTKDLIKTTSIEEYMMVCMLTTDIRKFEKRVLPISFIKDLLEKGQAANIETLLDIDAILYPREDIEDQIFLFSLTNKGIVEGKIIFNNAIRNNSFNVKLVEVFFDKYCSGQTFWLNSLISSIEREYRSPKIDSLFTSDKYRLILMTLSPTQITKLIDVETLIGCYVRHNLLPIYIEYKTTIKDPGAQLRYDRLVLTAAFRLGGEDGFARFDDMCKVVKTSNISPFFEGEVDMLKRMEQNIEGYSKVITEVVAKVDNILSIAERHRIKLFRYLIETKRNYKIFLDNLINSDNEEVLELFLQIIGEPPAKEGILMTKFTEVLPRLTETAVKKNNEHAKKYFALLVDGGAPADVVATVMKKIGNEETCFSLFTYVATAERYKDDQYREKILKPLLTVLPEYFQLHCCTILREFLKMEKDLFNKLFKQGFLPFTSKTLRGFLCFPYSSYISELDFSTDEDALHRIRMSMDVSLYLYSTRPILLDDVLVIMKCFSKFYEFDEKEMVQHEPDIHRLFIKAGLPITSQLLDVIVDRFPQLLWDELLLTNFVTNSDNYEVLNRKTKLYIIQHFPFSLNMSFYSSLFTRLCKEIFQDKDFDEEDLITLLKNLRFDRNAVKIVLSIGDGWLTYCLHSIGTDILFIDDWMINRVTNIIKKFEGSVEDISCNTCKSKRGPFFRQGDGSHNELTCSECTEKNKKKDEISEVVDCGICYEGGGRDLKFVSWPVCKHITCLRCLTTSFNTDEQVIHCPFCRREIKFETSSY